MKAVIQRVKSAKVEVDGKLVSEVARGILTLLAIEKGDTEADVSQMVSKIIQLRIFEDENSKMNLSLEDIKGEHLIVSQFTLAGDCSKGRRPSFGNAESPETARKLYDKAVELSSEKVQTKSGQFQANMQVSLVNDGPVTFLLED